nr:MAG TPA: hypothetical protein [Bacteriophage sp.]
MKPLSFKAFRWCGLLDSNHPSSFYTHKKF